MNDIERFVAARTENPAFKEPFSERIPAAIARAKELLDGYDWKCLGSLTKGHDDFLTATEVALAEALWWAHHEAVYKILRQGWDEHEAWENEDNDPCTHCAPLMAFTTKVESLG